MSAIVGLYQLNKEPIPYEHCINLMNSLKKFPADDTRTWQDNNIFLGCRAQWITPESINERLPFYDRERKLAITADAIIDNRSELLNKLHLERMNKDNVSDSELILHAYHKWGQEAPKHLIGDFVFMIWDEKKQQLFGARDFSGRRTLYFCRTLQLFAFCSAIGPLLNLPCGDRTLNEQWLAEFIAIPHMIDSFDAKSTVYKYIQQIPPSYSITFVDGRVHFTRFCNLSNVSPLKLKSDQEYVEAFRDVFQTAVNARLRTHRQVGAMLSGGLDSGAVVSFAAKALRTESKKLYTYTYIPPKDFTDWTPKSRMADERSYIKSTVEHVGNIIDHYSDFEGRSPFTEIDSWLDAMEMPYKFFENSFWLKGINELAKAQGVKILLTGGKGNFTISWGPAWEYYAMLLKNFNWISLYREVFRFSKNIGAKKRRVLTNIGQIAFPILDHISKRGEPYRFPVFINPELAKRTGVFEKLKEHNIKLVSEKGSIFELRRKHFHESFYPSSSGTAEAKMSLIHSLWNRDPTYDLRVTRFCLSVPENQYVQNGSDRALVRRATEGFLPDKVRLNYRFRGIQGTDWVHRMRPLWNVFIDELHQLTVDKTMPELIDLQVLKSAIAKAQAGPRPEWALDPDYKTAMRCLILYRFIKKVQGRG